MWLTRRDGGDEPVEVKGDEFVIGRDDESDVVVDDPKASRRHAALRSLPDGRAELRDLGTTNGTFVNERRIGAPVTLEGGETIRVGRTELRTSKQAPGRGAPTELAGVGEAATAAGAPAPIPAPARPSVIQRIKLQREVRLLTIVAALAGLLAIAAVVLIVTGAFDQGKATPDQIVKNVKDSTVLVIANRQGQREGNGTGWVLDAKKGLIVTNAHVVGAGTEFKVGVGSDTRDADVVGVSRCEDLAVLKVTDTSGLKSIALGSQKNLKLGQSVVAVGFPGTASSKDALTATEGVVSQVRASFDQASFGLPNFSNVVLTDAAINPGNSGGPLVTFDNKLVGVNTVQGSKQNQNYSIGVDQVKAVLPELTAGHSSDWTGMVLDFTPDTATKLQQRGLPPSIVVTGAIPGSPASRAGIGNHTVLLLLQINGDRVDGTLPSYCRALGRSKTGDVASYTFAVPGSGIQTIRMATA